MLRLRPSWVHLFYASLLCPCAGSAQEPATLTPGAWVRITPPKVQRFEVPGVVRLEEHKVTLLQESQPVGDGERSARSTETDTFLVARSGTSTVSIPRHAVTGKLVAIDEDWITMQPSGAQPAVIPRQAVQSIEVRTYKPSRGKRAAIGAVVGGATLAAAFAMIESRRSQAPCPYGDALSCGIYSIGAPDPGLAAFGGFIIGAPVGAIIGATSASDRWTTVAAESPRVSLRLTPGRRSLAGGLSVTF